MNDIITYRSALLTLVTIFFTTKQPDPAPIQNLLQSTNEYYEAGTPVSLKFLKNTSEQDWPLLVSSSYGKILVPPEESTDSLIYNLPQFITNKTGEVYWELQSNTQERSGIIRIMSGGQASRIETYLGPPSIVAGGRDFAMQISQPVDQFDNPLREGTPVQMMSLFMDQELTDTIRLKNSLAFRRIYSPLKIGRMMTLSAMQGLTTSEFTLDIAPGLPTDFTLSIDRAHSYADGNQICTFKTSIITDQNNNKVVDGTLVHFIVKNKRNESLSTYGTTIDGIAQASLIHPEKSSSWKVAAIVPGMAKSSQVDLNFESAISGFEINSINKKQIVVGPIRSFMGQEIPDGYSVRLYVVKNQNTELLEIGYTRKGHVYFDLPWHLSKANQQEYRVKAGDIIKNFSLPHE